jgi:hypothetical protein
MVGQGLFVQSLKIYVFRRRMRILDPRFLKRDD